MSFNMVASCDKPLQGSIAHCRVQTVLLNRICSNKFDIFSLCAVDSCYNEPCTILGPLYQWSGVFPANNRSSLLLVVCCTVCCFGRCHRLLG